MKIDEIEANLKKLVDYWTGLEITPEAVTDFARAFGFEIEYRLRPIDPAPAPTAEPDSRMVPRYVEDEQIETAVFGGAPTPVKVGPEFGSTEWRKINGLA